MSEPCMDINSIGKIIMKSLTKWVLFFGTSTSAWAGSSQTAFVSFKAYEVFSLKAENGSEIKIGEGQLSPRPTPIPENDWQTIGKTLGMKGNLKLCRPTQDLTFDELMAKTSIILKVGRLTRRLESDGTMELTAEEKQTVSSIPICKEFAAYIIDLGKALGLTSDSFSGEAAHHEEPAFSGMMINGISFANEGHGWLTVNSRLTTGQTAISHLGVKYRDYENLLSQSQYDVQLKYTKQPVALRFKKGTTYRTVSEGLEHRESCRKTVYVQQCTYDPETKRGTCEQVPYQVEGRETIRTDIIEEKSTNSIQFMAPDLSRVLGVAQLATKRSYKDSRTIESCDAEAPTPYPTPR